MKITFTLLAIFISFNSIFSQKSKQEILNIVFYNVENLYDIINDPLTEDDQFTPDGDKKWSEKRYDNKINDLAKVISAINKNLPDIVGLAEVENKNVLEKLINSPNLAPANYQIIHFDSPDTEGLDVALLYKKDVFKVVIQKAIPVKYDNKEIDKDKKARDILYVKGVALEIDTLHFFVNHWKSRKGKDDGKMRNTYASILENKIDDVLDINKKSKIIVLGDFNDEPTDDSVFEELNANNKRKNTGKTELYNLYYDVHNLNDVGTYSSKGKWYMFDQIMVTQDVLDTDEGFYIEYDAGKIFKPDWLLVRNPKANMMIPDETYGGDTYLGGVSNHLPVYITLKIK